MGGGLAIMVAATAGLVVAPFFWGGLPLAGAAWVLAPAWAYALIGLGDDLLKARGRGLRERLKFTLQCAAALAFGVALWLAREQHGVHVPFVSGPSDLGAFYIPFAALVIVATANAVNLSDGIDGLAGGLTAITLLGLAGLTLVEPGRGVAPLCWPFLGAVLGFLVYNLPPARLLMGDTGALGLGAALGALAILAGAEFWLLVLAAPFVVNATSVLIQMGTVRGVWRVIRPLRQRRTETARPFLCTPLHHHFQWLGWGDWRILALYWTFGALMALLAVAGVRSHAAWAFGLASITVFLAAAAVQKLLRGNYFVGLLPRPDQPEVVALFRGLPVQIASWPLYREHSKTSITEDMLAGAAAESILWRPVTEIEAHVVLGRIYADQKLFGEALEEWEQVPTRNLLLRPSVALGLARIYYGRDQLLDAIKLWEQLPVSSLDKMPNLREVVRSAKLRLADLAGKSHRQAMRMLADAERAGDGPAQLEVYLSAARRFNQELLSLLLYERDKLRGRSADPQAARARRALLHRTRNVVLQRIRELDAGLARLARAGPPPLEESDSQGADAAQRAAQELDLRREDLMGLLAATGEGSPRVVQAAVHPKASRNTVFRLTLDWPNGGPRSVIAKRYAADRITFFSACYRRERGVLELLRGYGCAVPQVYDGQLRQDQAVLIMEDLGDETLAERLEAADPASKRNWLRSAVSALAALHGTAHTHQHELAAEIRKIDKETLGPDYYIRAVRIALSRVAELADAPISDGEWRQITDQAQPLVDFLCERPVGFIHFEFTPHHLLLGPSGLHIFDFEQATVGPPEFDLAALLAQPESDVGWDGWDEMVEHYALLASESALPVAEARALGRAVSYAALFKCLVYAGAAANFLGKFGGEHHLQRFHYYVGLCHTIVQQWGPLRPFGSLLVPRLRAAGSGAPRP